MFSFLVKVNLITYLIESNVSQSIIYITLSCKRKNCNTSVKMKQLDIKMNEDETGCLELSAFL